MRECEARKIKRASFIKYPFYCVLARTAHAPSFGLASVLPHSNLLIVVTCSTLIFFLFRLLKNEVLFGTCMSLTWLRELLRERWMWKSVPFQRQTVPSPQLVPGTLLCQGGAPPHTSWCPHLPPTWTLVPFSLCPLHPRRTSGV